MPVTGWDCGCKIEYVEGAGKADGVTTVKICHSHAEALFGHRAEVYYDAQFYRGRLSEVADALIALIEPREEKNEES